ncbi:DUF6636 domain-containing protein [Rhodococcus sp. HNM0569]|uniref:DUF6636 domain-containing protein n=1 Tax=Rhodococcus sp. HNM0569 TaxID=2716340 RepID=UPI00146E4D5D|nr:DUF6636 domain-containing protein [Rhodococcus sp. HNM0569]NLU83228.1 hypothetical protein [Rhodococcus sp. HNM0569]
MTMRRMSLAVTAVGAALVLAGCGGSTQADAPAASTEVAAARATTTQAEPSTTTPAPSTTTESSSAAPTTTLRDVEYERNESYFFTTPDGGFSCGIVKLPSRTEAGCQGATSPVPPRPEDCMVDWGHGVRVENEGEGAFMCAGGAVYTSGGDDPDPVLPAGSELSKLGYTCKTSATDVTCSNDETGHGFRVASDSNDTF